jgi:hypothetical protein
MTWGQLKLQLTLGAAGVNPELIDGWLNTRYARILQRTDWKGLEAHATIQTTAAYQSGSDTVTFTVGSAAVAGSGTTWTSAITGQKLYRPGDNAIYTVTFVSATALTLDRPYEGNDADAIGMAYAAAQYVFMQNVYTLPDDCSSVISIINPADGLPMNGMSKAELDACVGPRTLVENPEIYALYDDSAEASPPVLHELEFYPPPRYSRGFPLAYRRAGYGFDGDNTSSSPLPFVTDGALLEGVRADIAAHLDNLAKATLQEGKFEAEVTAMLDVEHKQRRVKVALQMAPRFTRHRFIRGIRGFARNWGPGQGGPN